MPVCLKKKGWLFQSLSKHGILWREKKKAKSLMVNFSKWYIFSKHQFQLYKNKWENKYTKEPLYKLTKVTYNIYVVYTG